MPVIFFNIAWMEHYNGITGEDSPTDGGSWKDKHEVCNFSVVDGRCYGFVQQKNWGPINFAKIGTDINCDSIENVLVVWTAKKPTGKTVVVGFYRNAVLHRNMKILENSEIHELNNVGQYYVECSEVDAFCIPLRKRTRIIEKGDDRPGRHHIWYGHKGNDNSFVNEIVDYFENSIRDQAPAILSDNVDSLPMRGMGEFDPKMAEIGRDIQEIWDGNEEPSEKSILIKARLGQGKFRSDLDAIWNASCAITGCSIRELLRASHIKPWAACESKQERLSPDNGLLLSANMDALFDEGLISFGDDGGMIVSQLIPLADKNRLGLPAMLKRKPDDRQKRFLAYHRAHVLKL